QAVDPGAQEQVEGGIAPRLTGQHVEQETLRDLVADASRMTIRQWGNAAVGKVAWEVWHGHVWQLEQALQQAQLLEHRHRRGVDGITAKVPAEILVGLQQSDLHTLTGEQKRQYHAGWSTAGDTTI